MMAIRRGKTGRPTWSSETTEREKMGYILSRTGKNPRALNQTGYLAGKYATAQDMMQTLTKAYNDPYKKAKARAMYAASAWASKSASLWAKEWRITSPPSST